MSEAESRLARAHLDLEVAQSRASEAERLLREGKCKALAEYNSAVEKLEREVERAQIELRREQSWHKFVPANGVVGVSRVPYPPDAGSSCGRGDGIGYALHLGGGLVVITKVATELPGVVNHADFG